MTSSRTARMAGNIPPNSPMASVMIIATAATVQPNLNEIEIEAKLPKLKVSMVRRLRGKVASRPRAPPRAKQERLTQERDQNIGLGKAKSPHCADLPGPRADGGKHGVGRGEHGAEGQEHCNQSAGGFEK